MNDMQSKVSQADINADQLKMADLSNAQKIAEIKRQVMTNQSLNQ